MAAKKAVVLAAGLGTRLRPFTCTVPKPLLPAWGEPLLARIVDILRGWGVEDIAVNCHHLHGQIEKWCAENGCRAVYEPEILGTGGVLNPLREWIGEDDFYLVNADIVLDGVEECPFSGSLFKPAMAHAETVGLCLLSDEGPRTVEAEPGAKLVTNWRSPDPGWDGTFTYCGVAMLKAEILRYVEPSGFSSIVQAYERAMMDGKFIRGIVPPGLRWSDAGTVASYIGLNTAGGENALADLPQISAALKSTGGLAPGESVEFLGARGSDRCFFRAGNRIAIIYDDSARGENAKYAGHARWLKEKGIPVPEMLADLPEMKTLVMEFAGATDLKARISRKGSSAIVEYAPVVEALARFNRLDASELDLEPAFGPEIWKWERDLFARHCLSARFRREMPKEVEKELLEVAARLDAEPQALVHRDFQSTNVLFKNGRISFIDFQGMRKGPAAYDLASLLYDPYVDLSGKDRAALAELYAQKSGMPDVAAALPFAAVERLVQALGAYGRLAEAGQPQFLKHVPAALGNLLSAADDADLDAIGALAEDLLAECRP
ncbi:MAG: phosphotransferase [Kiritimatiellae bacterium]|nr:phosphotransferase [Kiritimatiellia bacterium]